MKPQNTSSTNSGSRIQRNSPRSRTQWNVTHACGHEVVHDLSDRPADRRAGFARWLEGKDCTMCWKAARDADTASKEQWLAAKRAEEQQAAKEWATGAEHLFCGCAIPGLSLGVEPRKPDEVLGAEPSCQAQHRRRRRSWSTTAGGLRAGKQVPPGEDRDQADDDRPQPVHATLPLSMLSRFQPCWASSGICST